MKRKTVQIFCISLYFNSDYRAIPQLDVYDPAVVDDDEYDEMEIGARREAERAMGKRDREEAAISGRMSRSLLYGMCMMPNSI